MGYILFLLTRKRLSEFGDSLENRKEDKFDHWTNVRRDKFLGSFCHAWQILQGTHFKISTF